MPNQPTPEQFLIWFTDHSAALADLVRQTDAATAVPTCPNWTMQDLAEHMGSVYEAVAFALAAADPSMGRPPIEPRPADVPLSVWFDSTISELLEAFTLCELETPVWTFFGTRPAAFWSRRMANETAIHHWDAAAIGGSSYVLNPEHGVALVNEFLDLFLPRLASRFSDDADRSVHLHATDTEGEWVLQRGADGVSTTRAHAKSTTAIRGPAAALGLFVWSRSTEELEVFGDVSQVEEWQEALSF